MKIDALRKFRRKLAQDQAVYGVWVTLEAPSLTELAVALGLDWIVIDAEHGPLDWQDVANHIRATVRSDTLALVRIGARDTVLTKRALDIGADGILIPSIDTVAQLEEALQDCRYPPEGRRGIGGERATVWGQCLSEHTAEANDHVLVIPLLESVRAISAVDEMCRLPGTEVFFFGPADFSASAGYRGQWEGPGVGESIVKMKDTLRAAGKHCGILGRSADDLLQRQAQGFRMLAAGSDTGLFVRSLRETLKVVARDLTPAPSLDPRDGRITTPVLSRPPEEMRPTRPQVMTTVGRGNAVKLQPGIFFEALVGEFNQAQNLTTGMVTFEPKVALDVHTHPCSESITVLKGEIDVIVEGRVYRLGPLDNILIPRWIPHAARNPSDTSPAYLHLALAASAPTRELVSHAFPLQPMPADSTGRPGTEKVNRFRTAPRSFGVGSGTEFIDFFNDDLVPGIEISGGFGRFQPGGRLPAHVHDFDESICIISGEAKCVVEGEEYRLSNGATAMVPRGRVHYFINESKAAMEMVWVYAGPKPERLIVDEKCATAAGNPWS